jgi:acyl-CoA synthetase (AMP-forming)/AMP-acid ligase II
MAYQRLLHFFPVYHNNGGVILLAPIILSGCCLVMIDKFSASRFGAQLVEHGITLTALNSTHIKMILAHPALDEERKHGVTRVQFALPLDQARREEFRDRFGGIQLVEVFGQTETCGIALAVPEGPLWKPGAAGLPLPGIEMAIMDDEGRGLAPGASGELCLRALSRHAFTPGYYNAPEQTRALYRDGWLRTGDITVVDDDGYMTYLDRKKDLIKRSGINIAAAEVERVMLEVQGVAEAAVVGIPDAFRDEKIIGFVVLAQGAATSLDEVERHCRAALDHEAFMQRAKLHPQQMHMHPGQQPFQFLVAADRGEGAVEAIARTNRLHGIGAASEPQKRLEAFGEAQPVVAEPDALRGQARGHADHHLQHRQDVLHFRNVEHADRRAAMPAENNDPFGSEDYRPGHATPRPVSKPSWTRMSTRTRTVSFVSRKHAARGRCSRSSRS